MFRDSKIFAVLQLIILILFIVASAVLFIMLNKEKFEKATLQNELAEVLKEKKKLSQDIEELKLIKSDLEIKLSGLEAQAKVLSENYAEEKAQNDVVRSKLAETEKELSGIRSKIETVASEKEKLQEMLVSEKVKYGELKERVDKLVSLKDMLEDKVRDIMNRQGIELERIVVKAEGELEGRVLVVNREYNFIVVDIGSKDDIELGSTLTVFRAGRYVGEAQVEKVYDTMSAATIKKESKSGAISVDDSVVVQND